MKNQGLSLILIIPLFFFNACQNKTVQLLAKKWDCVQVENLIPENARFQSPQDSADAIQLQAGLQYINWAFKNNMEYECAVGNRITVQGSYALLNNDKTLACTPETKNTVNLYTINSLTENELVLSSVADNTRLVLHFKPH